MKPISFTPLRVKVTRFMTTLGTYRLTIPSRLKLNSTNQLPPLILTEHPSNTFLILSLQLIHVASHHPCDNRQTRIAGNFRGCFTV
jgi:hypothetical protein